MGTSERVDDLIARGTALRQQGENAVAVTVLQRATVLAPTSVDAWLALSQALSGWRKAEAWTALQHAVDLRVAQLPCPPDDDVGAWYGRANLFNGLGHYEEALAAIDHSLTVAAGIGELWSFKSIVLKNMRRYEEALAAIDHAVTLAADDKHFWSWKSFVLRLLGRTEEAEVAERRAQELGR